MINFKSKKFLFIDDRMETIQAWIDELSICGATVEVAEDFYEALQYLPVTPSPSSTTSFDYIFIDQHIPKQIPKQLNKYAEGIPQLHEGQILGNFLSALYPNIKYTYITIECLDAEDTETLSKYDIQPSNICNTINNLLKNKQGQQ
ncbi:hypothetical protein D0S45_19755 [Marinifilum sp. JC120]|nr:hypothetical protein D0S45_19755 [Marinifilum sp. JC120]